MTLTSQLFFLNNRDRSISLVLFMIGIPNVVRGCILGWRSVVYRFQGHCDLDLDL